MNCLMKTILKYSLMMFAAVLGVACNGIKESAETVSFPEKEIVLTATREGLAPGTRSFRLDDGSVWWSPNEEVSVFYGAGSNGGSKFVSMNSAIAETVELQGSVQMAGSGKDFWAVYPYSEGNSCDGSSIITVIPDQQTGVEGNFSNDVFPTVAKSSSLSLAFWNICGGVKFFVSRNDIKSVSFKGNNNEVLAGTVKVSFGSGGAPVVQEVIDAKSEVTLVAPDGGTFKVGKYYYITLLPTELRGGITMVFETENTVGTLVSDKAQTIKRSGFGVLKSVDAKVDEWKDVQEASKGWDVFIWHDVKFKFDDLSTPSYSGYEGTASAPRLGITQANKDMYVTSDEFTQWVLNDVDVNMSGEDVGIKYDLANPQLILAKGGVEPGDELPAFEDAEFVPLGDISTYYSKSYTGLTLTVQSPSNWQRPFEGADLKIDNTFEELNKKDVHYVYFVFFALDNTKNIHIVIKFSFKVEDSGADPSGEGTADSPFNVAKVCLLANSQDPLLSRQEVYTRGIVSKIDAIDLENEGVATYYIQDQGYDEPTVQVWKGYYLAGTKFTSSDQLKVGDEVIIKGIIDLYEGQTQYRKRSKIVWLNGVNEYDAFPSFSATLNESLSIPDNSHITINDVTVVAKSAMGFVVSNGEHNLHVFDSDYRIVHIGDKVNIDGIKITYFGIPEIVSATATILSMGNDLPRTDEVDITTIVDSYTAQESDYISVTGTLQIEGSYHVVRVSGASRICSITNKPSNLDLSDYVGKNVVLKGYYCNYDATRDSHMLIYSSIEEPAAPQPEAVDLGLSVCWASFNVGATKPEEYGDYFAWGETEPKTDYSWSTYKWCNGDDNKLTKYCTNSSYWDSSDPIDYKTVLDSEDDAAHMNWGCTWRMPTDAEWTELRDNCTWTWTDNYNGSGIAGRQVTASNGKSIFLPAAGHRSGSGLYDAESRGFYWSSSLYRGWSGAAWHVFLDSGGFGTDTIFRYNGQSVRPVCPK